MILSMIVFIRFTLIVITQSSYMVMPQSSGHAQMVVEVPNILMVTYWGPNRVFGKTEDLGFLSVKKVKKKFLTK